MTKNYDVQKTDNHGYRAALEAIQADAPRLHFLQAPFYGAWQEAAGRRVLYYVVRHDDQLLGAGMAIAYPLPGGYHYLYSPYGPVVTAWTDKLNVALARFFRAERSSRQLFVRIDADNMTAPGLVVPTDRAAATASLQPRNEWVLDISPSIESLSDQLHKKARYHIRLAERSQGVVRFEALNRSQLDLFYDLMVATSARNDFGILPKSYYKAVFDTLAGSDQAFLAFVDIGGAPAAAALCVVYDRQAHYVFGCSSDDYRKIAPSYLLQWKCIEKAKDLGCDLYNFGGISDPIKSKHLSGVTEFKKRFNGYEVSHQKPRDIVLSPLLYRLFTLYKAVQRTHR